MIDWSQISSRDRIFLLELLVDGNAARAARAAGYAESTADKQAASWIGNNRESSKKPHLFDIYQQLLEARARECWVDAKSVLDELAHIGFADIGDYVESDEYGDIVFKNLKSMDPAKRRAIQSIETNPTRFGKQRKLKLHDKLGALVKLGQNIGLFPNKVELTGQDGGPVEFTRVPPATKEKLNEIYQQG